MRYANKQSHNTQVHNMQTRKRANTQTRNLQRATRKIFTQIFSCKIFFMQNFFHTCNFVFCLCRQLLEVCRQFLEVRFLPFSPSACIFLVSWVCFPKIVWKNSGIPFHWKESIFFPYERINIQLWKLFPTSHFQTNGSLAKNFLNGQFLKNG